MIKNYKSIIETFDPLKVIIAVFLTIYFTDCILHPLDFCFFKMFELVFHEAGHLFFMFFPHIIEVLGGTIMQLGIPLIFFLMTYPAKLKFESSFYLFWLGHSFIDVSVYSGDAVNMALPLVGGSNLTHDWNFILGYYNILDKTASVSFMFYAIGVVITMAAIILIFCNLHKEKVESKPKEDSTNYW